ncbi:MAG: transcriptional regulator, partial [Acidobacteria bacterium]|nr:transcriptional regulator [Acidobacteriota bacterium]
PFCSLALRGQRPKSKQYPKEINTLGDHIKKRRLDLGLLQKEVAERIGVHTQTITNWEKQRTLPEIRFIAPIIEFLGYDPLPQPKSFPERLKNYRLKQGLSQRKLAAKLGIDPSTIGNWECWKHRPTKKSQKLIDGFLGEWIMGRK